MGRDVRQLGWHAAPRNVYAVATLTASGGISVCIDVVDDPHLTFQPERALILEYHLAVIAHRDVARQRTQAPKL